VGFVSPENQEFGVSYVREGRCDVTNLAEGVKKVNRRDLGEIVLEGDRERL
jgi:hypothetical protein